MVSMEELAQQAGYVKREELEREREKLRLEREKAERKSRIEEEKSEREIEKKNKLSSTGKYIRGKSLGSREIAEVEERTGMEYRQPRAERVGFFEKHLPRTTELVEEIGQEVTGYIPRKLKETSESIRAERIARETYRKRGLRPSKLVARAEAKEQTEYERKKARSAKKFELELEKQEELQDIGLSAERAYRVGRAGKLGKASVQTPKRQSRLAPRMSGIEAIQRKRYYDPYGREVAYNPDPMGVYSLGGGGAGQSQVQGGYDTTAMNELLGYRRPRVQTGQTTMRPTFVRPESRPTQQAVSVQGGNDFARDFLGYNPQAKRSNPGTMKQTSSVSGIGDLLSINTNQSGNMFTLNLPGKSAQGSKKGSKKKVNYFTGEGMF